MTMIFMANSVVAMKLSIYLDDELGSLLTREVKQTGRSRNALIREALKEWFLHHKDRQWPETIMNFTGIQDFPSFESYRDELLS